MKRSVALVPRLARSIVPKLYAKGRSNQSVGLTTGRRNLWPLVFEGVVCKVCRGFARREPMSPLNRQTRLVKSGKRSCHRERS